jgi:hypothetical protein
MLSVGFIANWPHRPTNHSHALTSGSDVSMLPLGNCRSPWPTKRNSLDLNRLASSISGDHLPGDKALGYMVNVKFEERIGRAQTVLALLPQNASRPGTGCCADGRRD